MLKAVLTVVITTLVHAGIVALLVAIVLGNLYAVLHAWRKGRIGWCIILAVLFFTGWGGGIATAAYLFINHDEALPRPARRARAHA